MRTVASEVIARSGLGRIIGSRYQGRGVVFMLHSVVPDTSLFLNQPIRCSLNTFAEAVRWIRSQPIDIVTLDEALHRLDGPATSRRFAVFTFDDGYRDNLELVLPIMERHAAPFTIYVPTHLTTREQGPWWIGLAELMRDNDEIEVEAMGSRYNATDLGAKRAAMARVGRWVFGGEAGSDRAEQLAPTFRRYGVDLMAIAEREFMSLDELQAISRHPLVTIGGHTVSHCFLARQTEATARTEIVENKHFLEQVTNRQVEHLAYPYGSAGPREGRLARAAGYRSAVTTRNGTVFEAHVEDGVAMGLPREAINDGDTTGCLDCRARGVYRFVKSRGGSPIAAF